MLNAAQLISSIQEHAGSAYTVFGEISRDGDTTIALLARDMETKGLVVLCVKPELQPSGTYELSVDMLTTLDHRLPAAATYCPQCGHRLRAWARFCGNCGIDVSGRGQTPEMALAQLRAGVELALGFENELLGEMMRKEGGGPVFFARSRATKALMALSLKRDVASGELRMNETTVMKTARSAMDNDAFTVVQQSRHATPVAGGALPSAEAAWSPANAAQTMRVRRLSAAPITPPPGLATGSPVEAVPRAAVPGARTGRDSGSMWSSEHLLPAALRERPAVVVWAVIAVMVVALLVWAAKTL